MRQLRREVIQHRDYRTAGYKPKALGVVGAVFQSVMVKYGTKTWLSHRASVPIQVLVSCIVDV